MNNGDSDREEVAAVLALRPEVVVGLGALNPGGDLLHLLHFRRRRRFLHRRRRRCRLCRCNRLRLRRGSRLAAAAAEEVAQRALPSTAAHPSSSSHPLPHLLFDGDDVAAAEEEEEAINALCSGDGHGAASYFGSSTFAQNTSDKILN